MKEMTGSMFSSVKENNVDKNRIEKIKKAVTGRKGEIRDFLEALVNQNSYTYNTEGVKKVADILAGGMPGGFSRQDVDAGARFARHVVFTKEGKEARPVVLIGHMDTLWKPGLPFDRLVEKGDRLIGPAVNDMKAGLTVIVWSLRVLEESGFLADIPVKVIFNSDEETGSLDSGRIFTGLGKSVSAALVYEGAGEGGTVVTRRVGITDYSLEVTGVAGHAGLYCEPKSSALVELAHRIIWLESLGLGRDKLSVNAGIAEGGLASNIVPDRARCLFEIRFWDEKYLNRTLDIIRSSISEPFVKGCSLRLIDGKYRLPMLQGEPGKRLFGLVSETASSLGQKILEEHRNGGSDASWFSGQGVASIDGLGPVGDLDRTEEEYILTETLYERIELTANLLVSGDLYRLAE